MAVSRRRSGQPSEGKHWTAFAMSPGLDLAAGAVSGFASALVGQPGPPVLIYLLLAGAAPSASAPDIPMLRRNTQAKAWVTRCNTPQ